MNGFYFQYSSRVNHYSYKFELIEKTFGNVWQPEEVKLWLEKHGREVNKNFYLSVNRENL